MNKKIVIALGGNALETKGKLPTSELEVKTIKKAVKKIVDIIECGNKVILVHGNGPQVGRIIIQNELASSITPAMPFDVCDAMSQGMIGYHLAQSLRFELLKRDLKNDVSTIITQIKVDKNDSGFKNPSKPVGPFFTKSESNKLKKTHPDYVIKQDSNRGFRRVVASPKPLEIIELNTIKTLFSKNNIIITAGGGGIPVIEKKSKELVGMPAVIDKDFAASLVAKSLNCDILLILTAVDFVSTNFGTTKQKNIQNITVSELKLLIEENHFASGSMLPKIKAAIEFVESKKGRTCIIGGLNKAKLCIDGRSGTTITQ